ncbi:hypothetical protein [Streptomyces sp. NPDC058268]|uniref:hypothetical protein n=1 Tax=Streptomyces sp. NPDC058268 TaxID=3346413 RepID=UPI0036E3C452
MSEGFFKLAVHAESFQGGGLVMQCRPGNRALADRAGSQPGVLVDQEVRVGGVGPAAAPELQPFPGDLKGELIQPAGAAIDGQAPVADHR